MTAVSALVAVNVNAQELKTGYFLDNYLYGHRLNPAAQVDDNTKTFLGLIVNDVTAGLSSDLGLSNLMFPVSGRLVTGFNEAVSAEEFIGGLKITNKINIDLTENLFTIGCRTKNGLGFWTIEANAKSTSAASAPIPSLLFPQFWRSGQQTSCAMTCLTRWRASL